MSDLTIVSAADLAAAKDWAEFGQLLSRLKTVQGLSLAQIQQRARSRKTRRDLPRSTVSPIINGRPPARDVLLSLLDVLAVPPEERADWAKAWQRLAETPPASPMPRFDEVSQRQLGVHAAIPANNSVEEMPQYVSRDFDDYLRSYLSSRVDQGCFVILVGRSSSGKTRSLCEAVREVAPNWPIVQPANTVEIIDLLDGARQRIIVWLDEMQRFLGADPQLTKEHLIRLQQFPALVVATLWSDDYLRRKTPSAFGAPAGLEHDRRLLESAEVVSVPAEFSNEERAKADQAAVTDARIRLALGVQDAGLTQVLAAGPDLLHRWEHAPDPYAKAVISFAADARRLGVLSPIPGPAFESAVGGYLTAPQRVNRPPQWLAEALASSQQEVHGAVAALTTRDDGRTGQLTGYVVADYVAQHIRRTDCPPTSAWEALVNTVEDAEDLRRLALAAAIRMRYCHEEQALRRLLDLHGEGAVELASALFRGGRVQEALDVLCRQLETTPDDHVTTARHDQIVALAERVDELRTAAAAGDAEAGRRLAELLVDDGEADALRARADAGSQLAEEDLATLLADRGAIDELQARADAGKQPAADALAELLASHGRMDLLQRRAEAGDQAAARQLKKLHDSNTAADGAAVRAQLAHLRRGIAGGDVTAARQLTTLLFDLRNEVELRREVDAGTFLAAERLVALLNADETVDRALVDRLRTHGLDADGAPYVPREP
ncbi:hypothetical protein KZZ52_51775 [Dactylosporangium sp. AC04546]|uniref:hypothetical protein n=1 Tax=Dactylosporangium sp. AC04546 TaxID=2862460 RepID=UPI001EDEB5F0|nr:hypothetical protein [Dactylosporangium sp. AC04546]WVK82342.1 hypothetical protein KZZ52_51775 [Dactylosporangium sp. AC04546]